MIIIQAVSDYESIGLKSLLISSVLGLIAVVRYLYKSKEDGFKDKIDFLEKTIEEKDAAITKKEESIITIMENHKNDYKEANNDFKLLLEKNIGFMEQLKSAIKNER